MNVFASVFSRAKIIIDATHREVIHYNLCDVYVNNAQRCYINTRQCKILTEKDTSAQPIFENGSC